MYRKYREQGTMTLTQKDLKSLLKQVLMSEVNEPDRILDEEDVRELLNDDVAIVDEAPRSSIFGYPTRPLYRELSNILYLWLVNKKCPVLELPSFDLLDEQSYAENRVATISAITPLLDGLQTLWKDWSEDERMYRLREIIKLLNRRGLFDLLGIRKTVGTYEIWPPPRKTLENTYKMKHKPESDSILSVGARALAKHAHRDESSSWWGVCTGTEANKNEHAEKLVNSILDNATWINIHGLPHDVKVVEARQEEGYGVRWTCDGQQFRGFLEPQMEDGHAVGWKH